MSARRRSATPALAAPPARRRRRLPHRRPVPGRRDPYLHDPARAGRSREADGWSRLAPLAGEDRFAEIRVVGPGSRQRRGPRSALRQRRLPARSRRGAGRHHAWRRATASGRSRSTIRSGTIIFSLNDRTAVEGRLDMLVVDPGRRTPSFWRSRRRQRSSRRSSWRSQSDELIALLRLFAPTAIAQAEARKILAEAECLPEPLGSGAAASGG